MAEILKAESYTAVMKSAKEEVYTLFAKINVIGDGGEVTLDLSEGASVGAYEIRVDGLIYRLTLIPPVGFRQSEQDNPSSGGLGGFNVFWSFLGAPAIVCNLSESAGLVNGDAIITQVIALNFDAEKRPYVEFGFVKRDDSNVYSAVVPPENSQILVTLHYTTTDKK